MDTFWKIFWTVCAIGFIFVLSRPRSKEEYKNLEAVKKYHKDNPNENIGEPMGQFGTIAFWICFALFFAGIFFIMSKIF